ncbi:hypothetical protein AVEN_27979-1 [Araneus ventricosus]|uniref:SAP domain-containing protein n=1 Tax=Araneus ventricosus TaxID=182803 RepID=A0A4Y2BHX2_ARAVE|nr:hypothetical protein AVEN_27979-1 [Araneus ventricosus]
MEDSSVIKSQKRATICVRIPLVAARGIVEDLQSKIAATWLQTKIAIWEPRADSRGVQTVPWHRAPSVPIPNHKFANSRALYGWQLQHNRKESKSLVYAQIAKKACRQQGYRVVTKVSMTRVEPFGNVAESKYYSIMADEAASQDKIEDLDIENMKVAELKKKLKDIGLPITGNKSELVERLQGSILAAKNNAATNPGELESSSSELDSSLLNESSKLNSSSAEPEDKDGAKTGDDELPVSSPEKSKEAPVTKSAFIPLKKRVVAQTSAGSSEKPKEKKIILNRNHIPTPKFIPNKPAEPLKNKNVVTVDKSDITKNKDSKEGITTASTIKDGPNKIYLNAAKNISEDERISLRAKRFNITAPEPTSKSGKITITSKKDVASSATSTSSSTLTPSATVPTLDVLQKRALRFGENVSKVLRQLEEQQKVLKRKSKFDIGNGVSSAEEQEKKKKRAERFGLL